MMKVNNRLSAMHAITVSVCRVTRETHLSTNDIDAYNFFNEKRASEY